MTRLKKLFISIFLSLYLLVLSLTNGPLVPAVSAQEPGAWYNQSYKEWTDKVFEEGNPQEIFGERYTFAQVQWIIYSLASLLTGEKLIECAKKATPLLATQEADTTEFEKCMEGILPVGTDNDQGFIPGIQKIGDVGPIVGLGYLTDVLFRTKPASGVEYVSNVASNLHIIPKAKAQAIGGFGFQSLQPVQKIWRAFRNMAYALLIIVILAMAFMIMFKVKISPQVVISVQSALPKLVGILILITFSYAIAGLLVDLSYLLIAMFAAFAKSQGIAGVAGQGLSALEIAQTMWGTPWTALPLLFSILFVPILLAIVLIFIPTPVTTLPGLIALVVLLIFLFIHIIKIFWTLWKTFINVILLVIFGPLLIMLGGITPAAGFSLWFRNLAANLAVFPTLSIMIFLAHLLYWSQGGALLRGLVRRVDLFNPFAIPVNFGGGELSFPLFDPGTWLISILIPLGIILLMPAAAEMIKSVIQGRAFDYYSAITTAVGPANWLRGQMWGSVPAQAVRGIRSAELWDRFLDSRSGQWLSRRLGVPTEERGLSEAAIRKEIKARLSVLERFKKDS